MLPSLLPSLLPLWFWAAGAAQLAADELKSSDSIPAALTAPRATLFIHAVLSGLVAPLLGSPSRLAGAGQFSAWPAIPFRGSFEIWPRFSGSLQRGACQSFAAAVSVSDTPRAIRRPAHSASSALALGHDEQSLAPHGISGFGRTEYSCRNAEAQLLQCWDDGFKLSIRVPRDVFAEDKIRPALIGHADNFGGEEPLSVSASLLSGNAVVLAWVA